jgi:hypothetical protein
MGMGDVTPDQIANFDQALADAENNLDVLIDLWRTGDPDSPEHIRIAGLCVALGDSEWDRIAFVEILVAAIRRLDRPGQAATPDGPRRWALPDEPGPEVTAIRDRDGRRWYRERRGWTHQNFAFPWVQILRDLGPLTDATPAADGQDGRDG